MNKDTNKCPYCDSMEKTFRWSETSLIALMPRYDAEGNIIQSRNPNKTRTYYVCNKCGAAFSCLT